MFYTNSRYAKVGGLPQSELNQLVLQFLLLNDFRLVIPLEELQRYADQLLLYPYNSVPSAAQLPEDDLGVR
ncbi:Exocyst complex component S3 [Tulasnella sp. 418]|nr:Exocyst complex component S3 [Tulasnella sp. 418]